MVQGPTLGGDWAMDSAVAEVLKADFTVSGGQDHTVVLAADLAAALGIEGIGGLGGENTGSGDPVRLCFGLRSCPVNLVVDPGLAAGTLRVAGQIARTLLLPAKGRLGIYWSDPGHLRLGPLIGVLISTTSLASLRRRRNQVYEAFVRYGAEVGATIVFFTINGFKGGRSARRRTRDGRGRRPSQGHLAAYRLQGGRPVRVRTPLPRVIYDRCFGPGSRLQAIRLRHLTRGLGITVINQPVKITKLATYQALRENRRLRAVVPFAAPLSAQALKAAAGRFPVLYVKPDNLSRGWGVFRVRRHGTALLLERHPKKGRRGRNRIFATAEELLRWLPKHSPYLLQEAVDLATFMGNRFDFRALMQKDGRGRWQLTGLVARIAPQRGVVTSPRSGGMISPPLRVLQAAFGPEGGLAALETLRDTCLQIARQMEKAFGLCVELGIDIGITRDGVPKLIEVNGRPLKVSLDRLNDPGANQRIHRYPIYFAARLDMGPEGSRGPAQAAGADPAAGPGRVAGPSQASGAVALGGRPT